MATMEQVVPEQSCLVTEADYLLMEDAAQSKHEFRDGKIVDVAGASTTHVRIATNLARQLGNRLEGKPCVPYGSDLRVRINKSRDYVYPDVTVVCGHLEYDRPDRQTTITNPQVVFEVTSPSSETDDRGDKFNDYRRIEALQEYILISQHRARVETFYRQNDGIWAIGPSTTELSQTAKFRSLGVEIPLSEIYAGITFPAEKVKTDAAID